MLTKLASALAFVMLFALTLDVALSLVPGATAGDWPGLRRAVDDMAGDPYTIRQYLEYLHSVMAKYP
ncbi:hypothetical protein VW23_000475 [Devosia insulae DS-56]|uniref:Uncharacterized protein n=1 Tax=Devosia insulae DS-56 TaxID=1116389 RepID=A0A1E5XHN2_9HYPH|nr:hypothetical protein [Devosia insulae]OEO28103.1 hypothetical protein VW23_000475 [Devosia insulae DS-56]